MKRLACVVWAFLLAVIGLILVLRPTPPEPTAEARLMQGWEDLRERILVLNERLRPLIRAKAGIPSSIRERIQMLEREVDAQAMRARRDGWSLQRISDELHRIGWVELQDLLEFSEPLVAESA